MAEIQPFRAFRYDPARVDLASVATQPYDKISPEMQERYYTVSKYNLVRIILGKRTATDSPEDNPYTRAAAHFKQWKQIGVLRQDSAPSLYRYSQTFTIPGTTKPLERVGFIGLGRIEDYSAGVVFRHEHTLAKPKADRLDLLRATRAHFGQIFMLYTDPSGAVDGALLPKGNPTMEMRDEYGVLHRVWQVDDPKVIAGVQQLMREKKLVIADGHHRYETALNYRNERRACAGEKHSPDAAHEFVMMTFVNMDSPGLVILPTHRVVHGLKAFSAEAFRRAAGEFFSVEEADSGITAKRATAMLREAAHTGTSLIAASRDRVFLLSRPKAPASAFGDLSFRQQSLDVVQLHKCLLESALGISEAAIRDQTNVSYVREAEEALRMVREQGSDIAFLMNSARMQQVRDIAFAGEVLPQKSTDFYPKLLSGLTIYALD